MDMDLYDVMPLVYSSQIFSQYLEQSYIQVHNNVVNYA